MWDIPILLHGRRWYGMLYNQYFTWHIVSVTFQNGTWRLINASRVILLHENYVCPCIFMESSILEAEYERWIAI